MNQRQIRAKAVEPKSGVEAVRKPRQAVSTLVPAWTTALPLQAKLTINQPGDEYEQEADRVADNVMQMPALGARQVRRCACGGIAGPDGECVACKAKRRGLQRQAVNAETEEKGILQTRRGTPLILQRREAPYIKKITVHLTPQQSADLEWEGTPPSSATGSDHFTVSTGKGYSDPLDPPGTCTRTCCSDPQTQCAPPWNRPDRVGACCTYYGSNFWTGTPLEEHNTWKWWTPIQPFYSSRGIALHQHTEVTGQPIGHGCVRMEEQNAKRIYDYSNGRRTNVTIDGRAAPVACDPDRRCADASGRRSSLEESSSDDTMLATAEEQEVVPGLEGAMT